MSSDTVKTAKFRWTTKQKKTGFPVFFCLQNAAVFFGFGAAETNSGGV